MITLSSLSANTGLTARQRVEQSIARIEADNADLHAVSNLFTESALKRAEQLDAYAATKQPLAALHGIPILFKELVDIAGYTTAFGSNCYSASPAIRNAPIIDRLISAGAIILGTTHMVEFAVGSWGTNSIKGTPKNPCDRTTHRITGGSSSGSAVAVAADFAPIAFGSDTGGSIRIPASLCGVVGYKPSYGLIPMQGIAPTGPTFDTIGPLTKSVFDARLATEIAAGVSLEYGTIDIKQINIVQLSDSALEPIETKNLSAYRQACDVLSNAGAQLKRIDLPLSLVDIQQINGDIASFEAYQNLRDIIDDEQAVIDVNVRQRIQHGATVSEKKYQTRLIELQQLRKDFAKLLGENGIFILPGTPLPAPPLSEVDESIIPMSRYTRAANCLNLCAIALPIPDQENSPPANLPVGIQLAGLAGSDAKLLALAEAFENLIATPSV